MPQSSQRLFCDGDWLVRPVYVIHLTKHCGCTNWIEPLQSHGEISMSTSLPVRQMRH